MDETLVAGHIDDAGFDAVCELQRRKAEVERHAALAFLDPAIRVVTGQRDDERAFAVVDVSGGADYSHAAQDTIAATIAASSLGRTVRRSSTIESPSARPTIGGRPRRSRDASSSTPRSRAVRATPADGIVVVGRLPPPTADIVARGSTCTFGEDCAASQIAPARLM